MAKFVGILTSGGDCPGLNAAIRGVGKAALGFYGMQMIGFRDGFRGFMENRTMELDGDMLSGILTQGGTILGTSRDKPHRMPVGGKVVDVTDVIVDNYHKHHLDVLVCLGGGGTQKNAYRLAQKGLNIITLPKTIDNDVTLTDVTFGFDTALGVATEAIDRLHSTAHSHHRIIVVEIMGNKVGWLALGAGIAGGADAILIPEIPYDIKKVAEALKKKICVVQPYAIVVVAEGAKTAGGDVTVKSREPGRVERLGGIGDIVAKELGSLTGYEARAVVLGHLLRGGSPNAMDRILGLGFGAAAINALKEGKDGVMVALNPPRIEYVPLEQAVSGIKTVPFDGDLVTAARALNISFGD